MEAPRQPFKPPHAEPTPLEAELVSLDYAGNQTPGRGDGPPPMRRGDLLVVGRVSRLPPICVRTGRTPDEAEAAGTSLVPLKMSFIRRPELLACIVLLTGGCMPVFAVAMIAMYFALPEIRVHTWCCRGQAWRHLLINVAMSLLLLAGIFTANFGVLIFLDARPASGGPSAMWGFASLFGGLTVTLGVVLLGDRLDYLQLRRRRTETGDYQLAGAPESLLDRLPTYERKRNALANASRQPAGTEGPEMSPG